MRIFELEIDGEKYKACCGLRVLGELQKRYGSLREFERKLLPYGEKNGDEDNQEIDIDVIFFVAKLFLEEGKAVSDSDTNVDMILQYAGNPYALAYDLFMIYAKSMKSENEEDEETEKN